MGSTKERQACSFIERMLGSPGEVLRLGIFYKKAAETEGLPL